jgi:hypothetical protein
MPLAGQVVAPGQLYPFQPYGGPQRPMSFTGQLAALDVDEMPSAYRLKNRGPRWILLVLAALSAVTAAAALTYFVIRATRDVAPITATLRISSSPSQAAVFIDGEQQAQTTPITAPGFAPGTRHEVRVELARHHGHTETVDIPKAGGDVSVSAILKPVTGKLMVNTAPGGVEIWINGALRGRSPTAITDLDMEATKTVELRLKDYQPQVLSLKWSASGEADVDAKMVR